MAVLIASALPSPRLPSEVPAGRPGVEEYCRLAQLMLKKGQYDAARQSLQNVLNIKPKHIDSLLTLSRVYWGLYQFEKGKETFKNVKALDPENRKAQFLEATFAIDRMDSKKL